MQTLSHNNSIVCSLLYFSQNGQMSPSPRLQPRLMPLFPANTPDVTWTADITADLMIIIVY